MLSRFAADTSTSNSLLFVPFIWVFYVRFKPAWRLNNPDLGRADKSGKAAPLLITPRLTGSLKADLFHGGKKRARKKAPPQEVG